MIEHLPQVSLGTAAVIIFLICALYVIARGMLRMMVGTVVIAASAWVGFRAWQLAPELSLDWFGKLSPLVLYGLPVAVFLTAFFLLRVILKFLTKPFADRTDKFREDRFSIRRLAFRLPLLLVPTALLWLIAAVAVHHLGALEEIRTAGGPSALEDPPAEPGYFGELKQSVTRMVPAKWLAWLDPLTAPDRLDLAKLIAAQESAAGDRAPSAPIIDPETGLPYPRAIIVDDPELQHLARDGSFGTLLRHPHLNQVMEDPAVRRWIDKLQSD